MMGAERRVDKTPALGPNAPTGPEAPIEDAGTRAPGWQPVGDIWPTVVALGIGVEAMPLTPVSVPDSPVRLTSFGRVKDLYR